MNKLKKINNDLIIAKNARKGILHKIVSSKIIKLIDGFGMRERTENISY
jgi:hypothetical protein